MGPLYMFDIRFSNSKRFLRFRGLGYFEYETLKRKKKQNSFLDWCLWTCRILRFTSVRPYSRYSEINFDKVVQSLIRITDGVQSSP